MAKVRRYVKDHKLSYTVLPNAGAVNRHYGVRGFPTIVYIDKQGKIAGNDLGFPGRAAVEEKVRKILR